jgi:hypothetical protein
MELFFQKNDFLEKYSLAFSSYEKITNSKKQNPMTSGCCRRIPANKILSSFAKFQPVLTIGYQNSGTFSSRFRLPRNYNARRWRILTNMRARMNSLNLKNDLKTINHFSKIKEAFYGQIENDFLLPSFFVALNTEKYKKKKKIFYIQTNEA